jgi:hypothetical protein
LEYVLIGPLGLLKREEKRRDAPGQVRVPSLLVELFPWSLVTQALEEKLRLEQLMIKAGAPATKATETLPAMLRGVA